MAASFPGSLSSLKTDIDGATDSMATVPHDAQHNGANAEINAIEAALGTNPQGSAATVKARIAAAEQGVPVSTKTAAYTLVAGDAGSIVEVNTSSAVDVTVPNSVFAAGQIVEVCQLGAGQVTLVAGSGVTLRAADGLKIAAQYGSASVRFRSASEAVVSGAMTA